MGTVYLLEQNSKQLKIRHYDLVTLMHSQILIAKIHHKICIKNWTEQSLVKTKNCTMTQTLLLALESHLYTVRCNKLQAQKILIAVLKTKKYLHCYCHKRQKFVQHKVFRHEYSLVGTTFYYIFCFQEDFMSGLVVVIHPWSV